MNPVAQEQRGRKHSPEPEPDNPWRLGYRCVRTVGADGEETYEEVPLTVEDLLHPLEEDYHVTTHGHSKDVRRVTSGLEHHSPNEQVVVVEDVDVDLDLPGVKPVRPDVGAFELAEVPEVLEAVATVYLNRKQDITLLVMEFTSPETRASDFDAKFKYYDRAGVQQYVIVDRAYYPKRPIELFGYVRGKRRLRKQKPDSRGRIHLQAFDLWLGVKGAGVVLYDGDRELPDYSESLDQLEAAQQRADKAQQRADDAEAVARKLQAELDRLRNAPS